MRGSVLITIEESVTANLDHVCRNNHSTALTSVGVVRHSIAFTDTIGMNEKCRELNPTWQKVSDFSYKTSS